MPPLLSLTQTCTGTPFFYTYPQQEWGGIEAEGGGGGLAVLSFVSVLCSLSEILSKNFEKGGQSCIEEMVLIMHVQVFTRSQYCSPTVLLLILPVL